MAAVGIGVAVRQQAESGRCADLEQGQRLRQRDEQGEERGTATRLVGLRSALGQECGHLRSTVDHGGSRALVALLCAEEVANGCQEQVRLALLARLGRQERQQLSILATRVASSS